MKYYKLNISLIPPLYLQEKAFKLIDEYKKKGSIFNIKDVSNVHITIYYAAFPDKNIDQIISNTNDIIKNTKPLELKFNRIRRTNEYISIDLKLNENIKRLHTDIVTSLNPLREGYLREKYRSGSSELHNLPKANQIIAQKWGHPYLMDKFNPHITLAHFNTDNNSDKINYDSIIWDIDTFLVDNIVVFKEEEGKKDSYIIIRSYKLK